jgi:hypothetical protein
MQGVTLLMIVAVTTFEFLTVGDHWGRMRFLPRSLGYVPELLGVLAAVYCVLMGPKTRFQLVRPGYWFAFIAVALCIVFGIIANHVAPGPVFAGIRAYLRAVPWFFVPMVFAFTDKQLRQQIFLLLFIALVQVPFAIEQRIKTGSGIMGFVAVTGDWTIGTLMLSPTLTIFLIGAICIAAGFFVRKQINGWLFLLLFFVLLTPTMINETKVTLIILPLGLLVTFWCAAEAQVRGRQVLLAIGLLGAFLAVFVPTYNAFMEGREYGVTIGEFFFEKENAERYLSTGKGIGVTEQVGRADSVVVPLREMAKDPVTLFFGYGIGNATHSSLGEQFTGYYFPIFAPFLITGFARLALELGLVGIFLTLVVYLMIYRDALTVARHGTGFKRVLAAGFAGITAILCITIPYIDNLSQTSLSYLFWFYAGVVAAERVRLSMESRESARRTVRRREPFLSPAHLQKRIIDR